MNRRQVLKYLSSLPLATSALTCIASYDEDQFKIISGNRIPPGYQSATWETYNGTTFYTLHDYENQRSVNFSAPSSLDRKMLVERMKDYYNQEPGSFWEIPNS